MLTYGAMAASDLGEVERARGYAERVLGMADEKTLHAEALIARGMASFRRGNHTAAVRDFERALQLAESQALPIPVDHARLRLALALDVEGRHQEALELARAVSQVARLALFAAWAPELEGKALLGLGRLDEAFDALELSRGLYARLGYRFEGIPLGLLGDLHRERGSLDLARAAYERTLELSDDCAQGVRPMALVGLARLLAFEDPLVAERLARDAVAAGSVHSRQAQALSAAGWVALTAGDMGSALARANEAATEARRRSDAIALAEAVELEGVATRSAPRLRKALELWREQGAAVGQARVEFALAHFASSREEIATAESRLRELGINLEAAAGAAGTYAAFPRRSGAEVSIVTLGAFRVLRPDGPVPNSAWQSKQARDVLKILASHRGKPVPRDVLMEALWPEQDPAPLANRLAVLLATIRAVLDPEKAHDTDHFVVSRSGAVALDLAHVEVDVDRFLHLVEAGLDARNPELLVRAVELYAGDFLPEDAYEDWAAAMRDEARSTYVAAARALARHATDADSAARFLQRLLAVEPYDEEAHLALVETLVTAGRHGEARRRYLRYTALMNEIDVEPAPFPGR